MTTATEKVTAADIINDNFTRGIILKKARQVIARPGLSEQDIPALEQAMLARVIAAMATFDPEVGHRKSYVTTVVERFVKSFLRGLRREQAARGRIVSLNVEVIVQDEPPTDLQNTLSESVRNRRRQVEHRSDSDLRDLAEDMAKMIATLPADWQRMLELRKTLSMPQVAEEMAVSRRTLRDWMNQIAVRFEDAGLKDYLR